MKILLWSIVTAACFTLSGFSIIANTEWGIAEDYVVKFSGSGASGSFSELQGVINFDPGNIQGASMNVSVNVATISTGNTGKDKHAIGKAWFNAGEHAKISFKSESFSRRKDGYLVSGDLTMNGITRKQEIRFTFTSADSGGLFEGGFTVSRKDFEINGPLMAMFVGNEFDVELKVPVE